MVIDLAARASPDNRVLTLDTGRLPDETYMTAERVRMKYGINIEWVFPERAAVENLIRLKGLYSFRPSFVLPLMLTAAASMPNADARAARITVRYGPILGCSATTVMSALWTASRSPVTHSLRPSIGSIRSSVWGSTQARPGAHAG